jgi:hypothetical protein
VVMSAPPSKSRHGRTSSSGRRRWGGPLARSATTFPPIVGDDFHEFPAIHLVIRGHRHPEVVGVVPQSLKV